MGLQTVLDFNYRSKLWQYGVEPPAVMAGLAEHADVMVAGIEDLIIMLGLDIEDDPAADRAERYKNWASAVFDAYPNVQKTMCSLRESISASHNRLSACMVSRESFHRAKTYDITHIVDRVGAGDALIGGLIHGLNCFETDADALEFATAAGCLKHSIPGDCNRVSEAEVLALAGGDGAGRVVR
jgi:2-dehydro-3-deoxygluconokinase